MSVNGSGFFLETCAPSVSRHYPRIEYVVSEEIVDNNHLDDPGFITGYSGEGFIHMKPHLY